MIVLKPYQHLLEKMCTVVVRSHPVTEMQYEEVGLRRRFDLTQGGVQFGLDLRIRRAVARLVRLFAFEGGMESKLRLDVLGEFRRRGMKPKMLVVTAPFHHLDSVDRMVGLHVRHINRRNA